MAAENVSRQKICDYYSDKFVVEQLMKNSR